MADPESLVEAVLAGEHRALARAISQIENRAAGYREIVSALHAHAGDATVIGITGSPGAGKSTLVDKLATVYRDRGQTVGVIAVDPSSPFTGGAILGDRIRMASTVGDMDVFVRSMSARGALGGLSTATTDAVTALDAFGKDVVIIETVGAGQNEVEIVRTADTVAVLLQPGSGDDVQMLKAGILEIGDVFAVNKADMAGADRTVHQVREMLHYRDEETAGQTDWDPPVVETIATQGEGIGEFVEALDDHRTYLRETGRLEEKARERFAAEIRSLLREDAGNLLEREIEGRGGMDGLVEDVISRQTDPYTVATEIITPLEDCLADSER